MLWSHDVPCGVLCRHVVRSGIMCCGLVSCGVVWCGVVRWGIVRYGCLSGLLKGVLVAWQVGLFGGLGYLLGVWLVGA